MAVSSPEPSLHRPAPWQARGAGRTGRPAPRVFSHPSRYSEVSYLELDKFLEDVR